MKVLPTVPIGYGANVSNNSSKVAVYLPTVLTFPTIARRSLVAVYLPTLPMFPTIARRSACTLRERTRVFNFFIYVANGQEFTYVRYASAITSTVNTDNVRP